MSLVYTNESGYAGILTQENWQEILLKNDVNYGRSDPDADPCGYRAVLTMKLAEKYYEVPGLLKLLLNKDQEYIRPKETDLLALLEVGEVDYIFLYRSVAEQHNLNYLILPDEINLKNTAYNELYNSVSVEISGKKPGEKIIKYGTPMIYGITIPKNSPNPEAAGAFIKYLLNTEKGLNILAKNGQPHIVPSPTDTYENIPDELKKFASENQ